MAITLRDVEAAALRLRGQVERTPCLLSRTLSENTRRLCARVVLEGDDLDRAAAKAQALAAEERLTFIHPYDDQAVIDGQGTVALEMLEAVPDLDALVVPIGGGGLIAGVAVAA